jgi:nitronate monooxygenase
MKMRDTTTPTWANTPVAARLGIQYPIIQGPLGGVPSQRLTAAVSNFGGLGSFAAMGLTSGAIQDVIVELRSMTSKPFAVNLWVSTEDEGAESSDEAAFQRSFAPLAPLIQSFGGALPPSTRPSKITFEEQARVLIDARVPVFSFIFGIPPKEILDECRANGITIVGTATTPDEAIALEHANVDVIVASGFEAGGHRGSFLRSAEDSLTGTFSLVPQSSIGCRCPLSRPAVSPTLGASWRRSRSARKACRSGRRSSRVKNRAGIRCIGRRCSAARCAPR